MHESGDFEFVTTLVNNTAFFAFGNIQIPLNFTIPGSGDSDTSVNPVSETTTAGIGEIIPESSGEFFRSNQSQRFLIPDQCHYWNHPLSWKVFIGFNFIVMFCLPFLVS